MDLLSAALKLSKGVSFGKLGELSRWAADKSVGDDDNYRSHVPDEEPFQSRRARYVLYGHSHQPEIVPLTHVRREWM